MLCLRNVTTFIFIQSCIHFSPKSSIDCGRVWLLGKVFSSTSQKFSIGLRSGLDWIVVANLMLPEPLFHNLSLKNPGIVTMEYPDHQGSKKNWWKNLVIQYIQVIKQLSGTYCYWTKIWPKQAMPGHDTASTGLYGNHWAWWVPQFFHLSSYLDVSITLKQGKSLCSIENCSLFSY